MTLGRMRANWLFSFGSQIPGHEMVRFFSSMERDGGVGNRKDIYSAIGREETYPVGSKGKGPFKGDESGLLFSQDNKLEKTLSKTGRSERRQSARRTRGKREESSSGSLSTEELHTFL